MLQQTSKYENSAYGELEPNEDALDELSPNQAESNEIQFYIQTSLASIKPDQHFFNSITNSYPKTRITLSFFAAFGGYPFSHIAQESGGNNQLLGTVFYIATLIAYGGSTVWAVNQLIDQHIPLQTIELSIYNINKHKIKTILCDILGALSGLPYAYAAYKFNNNNISIGILGFCVAYIYGALGFHKLLSETSIFMRLLGILFYSKDKSELQAKKRYLNHIIRSQLIANCLDNFSIFYNEDDNNSSKINNFYSQLMAAENNYRSKYLTFPENWLKGYPRNIFTLLFLCFPITNLITELYVSKESAAMLINNIAFIIPYVAITVTPNFALNTYAAQSVSHDLFDTNYQTIIKYYAHNRCTYPLLNMSLLAIITSLVLASLASVSNAFVTQQTLKENKFDNNQIVFLAIATFFSSTLFESFTLYNIAHKIISLYSTPNNALDYTHRLIDFTRIIDNSKDEVFERFISKTDFRFFNPSTPTEMLPIYNPSHNSAPAEDMSGNPSRSARFEYGKLKDCD